MPVGLFPVRDVRDRPFWIITIYIEYQRKPKLGFSIEHPPLDQTYNDAPAKDVRFLRVHLSNRAMPRLLRWLGRNAAMHCNGYIQFHHHDNGNPIFGKPMPIRWSGSDEPISMQLLPSGEMVQLFDPVKYNAASRRNVFPGTQETIDVAARLDDERECFGWSNENYLPGKEWRNRDWELPPGRYLVRVTVYSAGETTSACYNLDTTVSRTDCRLLPANEEESKRVAPANA